MNNYVHVLKYSSLKTVIVQYKIKTKSFNDLSLRSST